MRNVNFRLNSKPRGERKVAPVPQVRKGRTMYIVDEDALRICCPYYLGLHGRRERGKMI